MLTIKAERASNGAEILLLHGSNIIRRCEENTLLEVLANIDTYYEIAHKVKVCFDLTSLS